MFFALLLWEQLWGGDLLIQSHTRYTYQQTQLPPTLSRGGAWISSAKSPSSELLAAQPERPFPHADVTPAPSQDFPRAAAAGNPPSTSILPTEV